MLTIDQIYRYRSLAAQRQGYCRLRIYKHRGRHVVLLSEIANNPGQSITASSHIIATGLAARYRLDPKATRWIEHFPVDAGDARSEDAYASVEYTWQDGVASGPSWQNLSQEQVETMIGVALAAPSPAEISGGANPGNAHRA